jgi:hypothetical protein
MMAGRPGGSGAGAGGAGGGGMMGGRGGGGAGGGFGGGPQTDYDHPFKSGQNKENLDRLTGG